MVFFAAVGAASLLGGISHGFLTDKQSAAYQVAWTATLIAIGLAAFSCWSAGARLWLSATASARVTVFAGVLLAIDLVVVLFVSRAFVIAIIHYLPAALFLLVSFVLAWRLRQTSDVGAGILGVVLTFVAAGIQQGGLHLHPVYFNSDALYHLVQGVALLLIFVAVRGALQAKAPPSEILSGERTS